MLYTWFLRVLSLFAFVYFRLFSFIFVENCANFVQILFTFAAQTQTCMANIRLFLDTRRACKGNLYPVKINIYHRSRFLLSTGVLCTADEWDGSRCLLKGKDPIQRTKNALLRDMLNKCEALHLNLSISGELAKLTAREFKQRIEEELAVKKTSSATLHDYLEKAKNGKAERTRRLFSWAQAKVDEFCGRKYITDVDEKWFVGFRDFLSENYSPNTVAQGMAWVSRALSLAVADGVISKNPAAGIRKPRQETRKKSISVEKLRELRDMTFTCANAASLEYARDIFLLQFYLMGINIADLVELREVVDGRIEYQRRKTGTLYSVKVMPEAMAIIEKWRGNDALIANKYKTAGNACSCITRWLKQIHPGLSTNYARHTWATLAAELELPIETVSHALGHKIGSPITAIYVAFNQKKVDEANRRVIDYVNADISGKK